MKEKTTVRVKAEPRSKLKKEPCVKVKIEPCVIVHGGAGTIPASREEGKTRGVKRAARVGYKTLMKTESAIQAVERAVMVMERDEHFNAGFGSVLTNEGNVEMDASIMCGRTMNFGCVSLVTDILHPISLARVVMQKSKHKFLSEEAAKTFARQNGIRILYPPGQLVTDFTSNLMQVFVNEQHLRSDKMEKRIFEAIGETGTVGAVAIDALGNIAVATSTGGIGGKLHGRIGDTPIIGCGTYCDNRLGGVSTTGHGDVLMRACLAHEVVARMDYLKEDIQKASENACKKMLDDFKGTGGVVGLDKDGKIAMAFTSQRMAWAYQRGSKLHFGIRKQEDFKEDVDADFSEDEEEE